MENLLGVLNIFVDAPHFVGGIASMLFRFMINIIVVGLIVHVFYYSKSKRRDYYFTFMMISVSIFMLVYFMGDSKLKTGVALGLFAIFGIIRYRTEAVPIREMTYLFFLVAISVVNGMSEELTMLELLIPNIIFILSVWVLESKILVKHEASKIIFYDNVNLIAPDKRAELIADIESRLGLKILRVEVGTVDFLRDSAIIRIYYNSENCKGEEGDNSIENITRITRTFDGL